MVSYDVVLWNGRLYVDPKPDKPNPSGYRQQQGSSCTAATIMAGSATLANRLGPRYRTCLALTAVT